MRAAVAAVISTANILVFAVVGLLLHFGARLNVPLSYFAVSAAITVVVLMVTWPQALRAVPGRLALLGLSLRSSVLLAASLASALSVFTSLIATGAPRSLYQPGAWPLWVCFGAAAVAYVRLELDPALVTALTPLLTRVPAPTRVARVLSAVSVSAFLGSIVLTVVGGLLSLPIPIPVLWVQPGILLVITVASLWRTNRWVPRGGFANLRAVTPIRLGLLALASALVQLPLAALIAQRNSGFSPAYWGTMALFVVFVIGLVASLPTRKDGPVRQGIRLTDEGPTQRGKRPRGAAPLTYVGELPQLEIAPHVGWALLPYKFPRDGYPNASTWSTGMLPQFTAEIGPATQEQKRLFARSVVTLTNSRLTRGIGEIYLRLDSWEPPYLLAGLSQVMSQPWQGMPVQTLEEEIAHEAHSAEALPLTEFVTTSGLQGHRRLQANQVDYWVTVDGGWAHLSCEDEPARITAALPQLDALAAAIRIGDRVVGRRKKPLAAS